MQKLNPQEQQLFAKYGKLPNHKNVLMKVQKVSRDSLRVLGPAEYLCRNGNTSIPATTPCPRRASLLRTLLERPFPTLKSMCFTLVVDFFSLGRTHSIPHASTPGNGHGNGHPTLSISPTNSTSPMNKESGLSHSQETADEGAPAAVDESVQEEETIETDEVADEPATTITSVKETIVAEAMSSV